MYARQTFVYGLSGLLVVVFTTTIPSSFCCLCLSAFVELLIFVCPLSYFNMIMSLLCLVFAVFHVRTPFENEMINLKGLSLVINLNTNGVNNPPQILGLVVLLFISSYGYLFTI